MVKLLMMMMCMHAAVYLLLSLIEAKLLNYAEGLV